MIIHTEHATTASRIAPARPKMLSIALVGRAGASPPSRATGDKILLGERELVVQRARARYIYIYIYIYILYIRATVLAPVYKRLYFIRDVT